MPGGAFSIDRFALMPEADRREKSSQRENLVRNTSGNPDSEARGATMKFHRTALLAASLLLFQTLQMAAQEQAVLGQGNVLCGVWLENRRGDDIQVEARTAWVLGYITAFNQYGSKPEGDVSGGKDTEELMAWIDNYCRQNPADNVYRASAALVDQFRQRTGR